MDLCNSVTVGQVVETIQTWVLNFFKVKQRNKMIFSEWDGVVANGKRKGQVCRRDRRGSRDKVTS